MWTWLKNKLVELLLLLAGGFKLISPLASPQPSPVASTAPVSPEPSPSPSPLSFTQMNQSYGPCAVVPTLMYHHIRESGSLSVTPEYFQKQLQYLKDKNYSVITMQQLINFFDAGTGLPSKPVLLTFDDAYDDFVSNAFPLLQSFGYPATAFVPTGLINNPGYLTWEQINDMKQSGQILFANHTWSHHNLLGGREVVEKEVGTADTQLTEKGMDNPKVLAYPYGPADALAESILGAKNYLLAFTTTPGSALCKKQRLYLPRRRIGNAPLNQYGL